MMTWRRSAASPWWAICPGAVMALLLAAFVACGEDSDAGDSGEDGNGEGNDGESVAAIVIGGSAKDVIPTVVFIGLPVILTVVPQDADGNHISTGTEDVLEVVNGIQWSSSDVSVATVAVQSFVQGPTNTTAEVTTLKAGTVTITASYETMSDSITLTVKALF